MKTKFLVEFHGSGVFNENVIRMITNHNEGKVNINFSTIIGFINGYFCCWPTITPETECKTAYPGKTMEIIEGDKHTLTLTIKELHQLDEKEVPTLFTQPKEGLLNDENNELIN